MAEHQATVHRSQKKGVVWSGNPVPYDARGPDTSPGYLYGTLQKPQLQNRMSAGGSCGGGPACGTRWLCPFGTSWRSMSGAGVGTACHGCHTCLRKASGVVYRGIGNRERFTVDVGGGRCFCAGCLSACRTAGGGTATRTHPGSRSGAAGTCAVPSRGSNPA